MLRSVRYGGATNSSSSHSVVFITQRGNTPDVDNYGRFYSLTSKDEKLEAINADDYLDYEFEGAPGVPYKSGIDPDLWSKMILSDDVVLFGVCDESGGYDVRQVNMGGFEIDHWSNITFRQDGNAIIGYERFLGTKFRWSEEPYEKSSTPELVDLKITDFCGYGCTFCYQGSTKAGKHAPLETIKSILDQFAEMGTFEMALGGGEPCHHPDFTEILSYGQNKGLTMNFTAFGTDWKSKLPDNYNGSIGLSVHSKEDIVKYNRAVQFTQEHQQKNHKHYDFRGGSITIVPQFVIGATPLETIKEFLSNGVDKFLMLGYKTVGRGETYKPKMPTKEEMKELFEWIMSRTRESYWDGEDIKLDFEVSVDTAFLDQYNDVLDDLNIPRILWASPEGKFSMYVDAVETIAGPSSYIQKEDMDKITYDTDLKQLFAKY